MQQIIASYKNPKNIIGIDDCKFDPDKIYVCKMDDNIRVLVEFAEKYHWSNLELSNRGCFGYSRGGYSTAKEAVEDWLLIGRDKSVYVFDNQCELEKWAR